MKTLRPVFAACAAHLNPSLQSYVKTLYFDSGKTIQKFLQLGLVQRVIITRVPVLIGEGIPFSGKMSDDIKFRCIRSELLASGMEQAEYEIVE